MSRRFWKFFFSILIILCIVGAAGGAVYYIYMQRPQPQAKEAVRQQRTAVRVEQVAEKVFRKEVKLLGTAHALQEAEVAAQVAGYVIWLSHSCEPGLSVQRDQELVRIDPQPYRIAQDQAEATLKESEASVTLLEIENESETQKLEQAAADLEAAQNELDRRLQLHGKGVISSSELDTERQNFASVKNQFLIQQSRVRSAEALLARSEAKRLQAQAERDRAAMELGRTALRAPFEGSVASRSVDLGDYLQVGDEAFSVVDYSTVVVRLEIPARYLDLAVTGREITVEPQDGAPARKGELRYISPRAVTETRLFEAKVYVQNKPDLPPILPGQFVRVVLQEPEGVPRILAPFGAVTQDDQGSYVFVVEPDTDGEAGTANATTTGLARKQYVGVLWRQGQQTVLQGLAPGALLVVGGQENLAPDAPVTILREAQAQ